MPLKQSTTNTRWTPKTPTTVNPATPIPAIDPTPHVETPPPARSLAIEATKGTRFDSGEAISVTTQQTENIIDFGLVASLRNRKVYAYLWINPVLSTNYSAKCEVTFWRNNSKIGSLPLAAALSDGATQNILESVATALVTGGNVVDDCIGLYLAQPTGTQPTTGIVLQPQYCRIEADRITVSTRQFVGITSIRLWLGVVSSEV